MKHSLLGMPFEKFSKLLETINFLNLCFLEVKGISFVITDNSSQLISFASWECVQSAFTFNVKCSLLLSLPVSLLCRALTAVELRKKLLGKRFSPNAVEAVISKLQRKYVVNFM